MPDRPLPHHQVAPRRRWLFAGFALLSLLGSLLFAPLSGSAAPTPPPNPSDQQISAAKTAKAALATLVGELSGQVAAIRAQVDRLDARAELAEQKLANALAKLTEARDGAALAKLKVAAAQVNVDTAEQEFSRFIHDSYMGGSIGGLAGSLLTAPDPNVLLERTSYESYVAAHQLDAIGTLDRATVAKSNADAAARRAVQNQTKLADEAARAQAEAAAALDAARKAKAGLEVKLASTQGQLDAAQDQLATLNNQRATYLAYKAEQARIAAAKAAAEQKLREQAAAAARARAAQAARDQAVRNENGSDNGTPTTFSPPPSQDMGSPTGGSWSPAKAQAAVDKAMGYLGIEYAFAAGNRRGPTYGVCVSGDAWNDCHVYGFDCSGLSLYAWGGYLSMDHYAATQYGQVGSYHPGIDNLLPGDLVFWSSDGSRSGIHHVAIYIGNGNVVQAPQSGDIVRVTPIYQVDSGYYGATRPLT